MNSVPKVISPHNITDGITATTTHVHLQPIAEFLGPETVTPLVTYLCSEECEHTHEVYSVGGGRFARIFVGLTQGWVAGKGAVVTAEQVRDQFEQIRDPEGYIIPTGIGDEMKAIAQALK